MQTRSVLTVIFTIIVIAVLCIGFYYIGSPEYNRKLNIDKQKRADLWKLSSGVSDYVYQNCRLPESFTDMKLRTYNHPKLEMSNYSYKRLDKSNYELCADFNFEHTDNPYTDDDNLSGSSSYRASYSYEGDFNEHKAGKVCFKKKIDSLSNKDKCKK